MGCRERRQQEKRAMKQRILDAAMALLSRRGLCGLTMRGLAEQIEYSPSIVYEHFENKEVFCSELCALICKRLLSVLKKVSTGSSPDEYLLNLVRGNVEFLRKNPQGVELLTLVCFGSDPERIPKEFLEIAELYSDALKKCHCKQLDTEKELEAALDVIRSLHVGMLTLSKYQTSAVGLRRIGESLENGIRALLKGWKN